MHWAGWQNDTTPYFALADVLYRANDLSAARERYYAALEIDEYVTAKDVDAGKLKQLPPTSSAPVPG